MIVGIAIDNYKQTFFEKHLKLKGFSNYQVKALTAQMKIIQVTILPEQVAHLAKVTEWMNTNYKRQN